MSEIRTLSVLVATPITDAMLISGATSEDSSSAWASGTFAIGDIRHVVATHRRYKCAVAGSSTVSPELDPTRWKDIGPTNKWAMFDRYVSTATVQATSLTIVLRPGMFNAIELRGVDNCNGITVTVKDAPGGNVLPGFPYVDDMEGSEPGDWWEFWYMPFYPRNKVLLTNIEPYVDAEVTIVLTSTTSVSVGMLQVGDFRPLARTKHGSQAQFTSYAYVDIDDETGENVIEPGPSARNLSLDAWLPLNDARVVDRTLQELLAVPCSWYASTADDFEGLNTYGLGDGVIDYTDPNNCNLTQTVKGLI
jgi:hypothetical protein